MGSPTDAFHGVRGPSRDRGRASARAGGARRGDRIGARHHRHGAAGAARARRHRRPPRSGPSPARSRSRSGSPAASGTTPARPASRSTGSSSTPASPPLALIAAVARERATALATTNQALARELHAAQLRLDGILGSLGEAVTVHDERGKTVYANDAAARLLGCDSVEEVLAAEPGQLAGRFTITHEDGSPVRARGPPRAAPDRRRGRCLAADAQHPHRHRRGAVAAHEGHAHERPETARGWRSTSSRTSPSPRTPSCASGSSPRPASCSPPRSTTSRRSSGSPG